MGALENAGLAVASGLIIAFIIWIVVKTRHWTWHWCKTFMNRTERREVLGVADSISSIMLDEEREGIITVHREEPMPFRNPIMDSDLELGLW